MAKLNWQKLRQQSKQQTWNEQVGDPSSLDFDKCGLWTLPGKYYGIHYSKLPTDYLFWILDNSHSGKHKGIAENEVYRRYHELPNT